MKERPILFSGQMVRAIIERRKTQTRRVVTGANSTVDGWSWNKTRFATLNLADPELAEDTSYRKTCGCFKYVLSTDDDDPTVGHRIRSRWTVGDRLWVRETWIPVTHGSYEPWDRDRQAPRSDYEACIVHRADSTIDGKGLDEYAGKWRPSIFLPRWASRITLELTDVRVQRVQEISHRDALAEGVEYDVSKPDGAPVQRFNALWDSINAGSGFGWDLNPWVWALTFRRVA